MLTFCTKWENQTNLAKRNFQPGQALNWYWTCVVFWLLLLIQKSCGIISSCWEIGNYWLVIKESQFSGPTAVAEWLNCLPLNPGVVGLSPLLVHNHDSSYDTSTGLFQQADSRLIYLSCKNLFHNQAKVNMFKLN